ncbi:DUF2252 domain-containing protein [Kitasatospora sp. NPDC059571]|uniref:DUF2252 domain-containing protein n=1 Tax=Kitasatospora sp. NPDC059571 TaxID=3346871 RepID=UPI0036C55DAF
MPEHLSPAERRDLGRAARKRAPRSAQADGTGAAADRPDPVAVLTAQAEDRLAELLPIRYGRMAASPFAFLRGAAAVMAADLAAVPHSGLTVQLCGDAHLLNFGVFGSPERALLFDLNDFDETLPGPFEWDVKRLAASLAVAARSLGAGNPQAAEAVLAGVEAYRTAMRQLAGLGELAVWYLRIDAEEVLAAIRRPARRRKAENRLAAARRRDNVQAAAKLTETVGGRRRIVERPPLLTHAGLEGLDEEVVHAALTDYRASLPEERRALLDRFRFVDAALKVVGVGSVGTRCLVALLQGRDQDDLLLLQFKEAGRSVLEDHLPPSTLDHHGHRVVAGQRLLQAAGDIFLGWMTGPGGRHFYWRQLRDMKGSVVVEEMSHRGLCQYAALCGTALARAHARSGDRIAIAGYLGGSDTFDRAVARFAVAYADRTDADHALLAAAVASGRIRATEGI